MTNILIRKLELFEPLSDDDKAFLDKVVTQTRSVPARHVVVREGESPSRVRLIIDGFAVRSKTLPNGERQILAYMIPGDFCDMHVFILQEMDHDIETIAATQIVDIPRDVVLEMTGRPSLARALWWATMVDEATLREWIVNMGRRKASQRIAHLFCEMHARLRSIGLGSERSFEFPLTQADLGATVGLSTVHVNRSLRSLAEANLVEFKSKTIRIQDVARLEKWSGFSSRYLHLAREKSDVLVPQA